MSSVLPYTPSPRPSKKWGWRDSLLIAVAMGLICTMGKPYEKALVAYDASEFLMVFVWSMGAMVTFALSFTCLIVAFTHEASASIRQFFRDRPNALGFGYIVGWITSFGLCLQMAYLAISLMNSQSFVAVSYAGSAVFFALLTAICILGFLGWVYGLIDEADSSYILAARNDEPHDW